MNRTYKNRSKIREWKRAFLWVVECFTLYQIIACTLYSDAWKVVLCYAPLAFSWTSVLKMELWKGCDFVQKPSDFLEFHPKYLFSIHLSFIFGSDVCTSFYYAESWKRCVDENRGKWERERTTKSMSSFFTMWSRQNFARLSMIWNFSANKSNLKYCYLLNLFTRYTQAKRKFPHSPTKNCCLPYQISNRIVYLPNCGSS